MARELKGGGQPRYAAGGGGTPGVSLLDPPARPLSQGASTPAKAVSRRLSGSAPTASGRRRREPLVTERLLLLRDPPFDPPACRNPRDEHGQENERNSQGNRAIFEHVRD